MKTDHDTLRHNLQNLKESMMGIEVGMEDKLKDLEKKQDKWKEIDSKVLDLSPKTLIRFNISGKKFTTYLEHLTKNKDTLFYKLLSSRSLDIKHEIYLERSFEYFGDLICLTHLLIHWSLRLLRTTDQFLLII